MKPKPIEQIEQEFLALNLETPEIYKGIMAKDSWYAWKRRGLPKNVLKYFQLLQRLEELKTRQPVNNGWGPSNNHSI